MENFEFFDSDYLKYLPDGLEVYYGDVPENIKILLDENICECVNFPNRFSQLGL